MLEILINIYRQLNSSQSDITKYDIGGINFIYDNRRSYDLVIVFDGTTNFTSPDVLNAFKPFSMLR